MNVSLDLSHVIGSFVKEEEYKNIRSQVENANDLLRSHTGSGSEFLGWMDLPTNFASKELESIKKAAKQIQEHSDLLIVIGIGGSYLGAKAAIDFLSSSFYNQNEPDKRIHPELYFAGTSLSASYLSDLMEYIEEKDFSINVISKSGTTTETSIAYRFLKEKLIDKYGKKEAKKRIFVTTDVEKGSLRREAEEHGYQSFVIPDNIGGRFTVLTAVGLLPIAVAGHDIEEMLRGASDYADECRQQGFKESAPLQYAAVRNLLYRRGYKIEILSNFEPTLTTFSEWWKQLFGESEGKDGKGIFPASLSYTTDLHSMGQYIQDGQRILFETILHVKNRRKDLVVPSQDNQNDGLGHLEGKSLNDINDTTMLATLLAHLSGGVPVILITIDKLDAYSLGQIFFFFELSVAISAYLNAVNPFDQPGVEDYKVNMNALLGKPGYEKEEKKLRKLMKKNEKSF